MKRKGFTLIELVVVIALIAILAVTLAPRLRDQIAKAGDAKAIAVLGSLRTGSEVYFADNQATVIFDTSKNTGSGDDAIKLLKNELDASANKLFDEVGTDGVIVPIGGSQTSASGTSVIYGGNIGFVFEDPTVASASGDGISLWFAKTATAGDSSATENDTKDKAWAEY